MKDRNLAAGTKLCTSIGLATVLLCSFALAQAPAKTPLKPAPVKPAAVKPAPAPVKPAPAPVKPVAAPTKPAPVVNNMAKQSPAQPAGRVATTTPQNAATTVTPAAARAQLPATGANNSAATGAALAGTSSSTYPANGATTYVGGSNGPRSAVAVAGVGSFNWSTLTLTAYGCFRSGSRVLCDFDVSNQNSGQISIGYWGDLALVDDGGKMSRRSTAFFMGNDGSQFDTAFVSQGQPVRYLMQFDDVSPSYTSIALVWQNKRIAPVAIAAADPNQPAGTIPGRGQAAAPATDANGNPIDKANAALGTVQDTKGKAKSFWQQMKDTANAAKTTANPKQ